MLVGSVLVVAVAVRGMRLGLRARNLIAVPVTVLTVPIALCGVLLTLITLTGTGCESFEQPVWSPDRTKAVRTAYFSGGALGGSWNAAVFRAHGFSSELIFTSEDDVANRNTVHWSGNDTVQIDADKGCLPATSVTVRCTGTIDRPR